MSLPFAPGRRRFLVAGAALGGLLVGCGSLEREGLAPVGPVVPGPDGALALNAWLRIAPSGGVTVAVPRSEMGQGVYTGLAMLVAEELEVPWEAVQVEQAPLDPVYANVTLLAEGLPDDARLRRWFAGQAARALGLQVTGGSTSVRDAWLPMRRAGAVAREMLRRAAARRWQVPPGDCEARAGRVLHAASGREAAYGELVADAARVRLDGLPALKPAAGFTLIGSAAPRLDIAAKLDGSAEFGIDVRPAGLLHAAIRHGPVFGSRLVGHDAEAVRALPGVEAVVALDHAVAVVADGWWRASRALAVLPARFEGGATLGLDTEAVYAGLERALAEGQATTRRKTGRVDKALAGAATRMEARYRAPYLAHACMEPMNCTARVDEDGCEVWVGNQFPSLVARTAAEVAGVAAERVRVHTPYLGGGFGRRAEMDVVREAVAIARALPGRPVKLIWSREEDIRHDVYRPAALCRFEAGLDARGRPVAWHHRIASPSATRGFLSRHWPRLPMPVADRTDTEGAAELPYAIPAVRVEHVEHDPGVPVGYWRAVGHSQNAFFVESFVDELAHAAGSDPVEFRRALLGAHPRHLAVLEAAARAADWGRPLPPGRGRGVALHASFGSIVAQVVEAEVSPAGAIRVARVVCAIDCGVVVNPDSVRAQMEGGIVFALGAALQGEITLREGAVVQSNFGDYPLPRLADTPAIEVLLVPGGESPGGVGEPGVPPLAPALANAVFAATGERLRSLPLRPGGAA